jgi:23S rRNA-/tRNA-specific pseudouridylate synthase
MQWVDALQVDPDNKYVQRLLETVMSVDELAKKFSVTKVVVIGINVTCCLLSHRPTTGKRHQTPSAD